MNINIYGVTQESANRQLIHLMKQFDTQDIVREVYSPHMDSVVITKNGDVYKALLAGHRVRGYKWQYAYIDKNVSKDIINLDILPTFVPKQKIKNMFQEENVDKTENCYEYYEDLSEANKNKEVKLFIVFGETEESAEDKLSSIRNELSQKDIYEFNRNEIVMKNGDRYITMQLNRFGRGTRWNYAYIDKNIDQVKIDQIIIPNFRYSLSVYKSGKWREAKQFLDCIKYY